MSTIYIVYESNGERYEYHEWPLKAFLTQEAAIAFKEHKEATTRKPSERFTKISERINSWCEHKLDKTQAEYQAEEVCKMWDTLDTKLYERYPTECCDWEDSSSFHIGEVGLEEEA